MIISAWTDELIARLEKLFHEGLSARLIANELGVSRNAVIGKFHRMGLKSAERVLKTVVSQGGVRPKNKPVTRIRPANSNSNAVRIHHSVETTQYKLRCVEIVPRHLSIIDLEPGDCRYPYGDGTITFCGHPKAEGSSYCMPHKALCTEAPRYQRAAA